LTSGYLIFFEYPFEVFKFLILVPLVAIAISCLKMTEQQFYKIFILAASYTLLLAIYIVYYQVPRSQGVLESPIILGNLGVLFGVVSLIISFAVKGWTWKALGILFFFSGITLSFLSASRGGWLAIILALLTILSLVQVEGRIKKAHIVIFILSLLTLLLYLFWDFLPIQVRVEQAIQGFKSYLEGDYRSSVGYRFEMWKAGWYGFLDKPWFGWGFTNYNEVFKKYLELGLVRGNGNLLFGHPHNDFIQILVEFGLVGFIIVMSAFIYPLIFFLKQAFSYPKHHIQVLYLALIGIIMIEAIFEFMLTNRGVTIIYVFYFYIVMTLSLMKLILQYSSLASNNDVGRKEILTT
jgi:O-antigen ligase